MDFKSHPNLTSIFLFSFQPALIATLITTQVTSISVSDGNGPRHLRPLGPVPPPPPGPNHPALRRYASGVKGLVPGGGGGGRPPPRLTARVDSPSVVGSNSTTVDRNRRLIPYMTFYIPSSNGDFSLPINQAYNYMPIVSIWTSGTLRWGDFETEDLFC